MLNNLAKKEQVRSKNKCLTFGTEYFPQTQIYESKYLCNPMA